MRLTCPNCEAQYEVPDEVIPESGRDVQCSNCGDTWFQPHPDHAPAEPEEDQEDQTWQAPSEPEPEPEPEPEVSELEDEPEPEPERPVRKELDSAVSEVLREEADRERAAREREAERGGLETQPDLGLDTRDDETEKRNREARARMARLRGEPEDTFEEEPDLDPGTRRNLLPDIDEINSSLDSDTSNTAQVDLPDSDMDRDTRPGGFRRGFRTMVLLAMIGLLLYVFAPMLAESVPALKGPLSAYVELVNQLRGWLDNTLRGLLGGLDNMSSEGG